MNRPVLRLKTTPQAPAPRLTGADAVRRDVTVLRHRFRRALNPPKPLAIGIREELKAATGWSRNRVGKALRYITSDLRYLRAMSAAGSNRHNLQGMPVEPVSGEHRRYAQKRLREVREQLTLGRRRRS